MKTKVLFLASLLLGCLTVTAQTTHFIDWDLGVGANASITIDVGDTIEWEHTDPGMPHDVVSSDPNAPAGFGSGFMNFGDTYSFTFTSPVVFDYGCGIHPGAMDGTITVVATVVCDPPTNLALNNITTTTANISWAASASETNGYNWVVMNMGDNPNTASPVTSGSVGTGITTASITGLSDDTMYQIYVRTNCGADGLSDFSNALNVQTDEEVLICDEPTGLALDEVSPTSATISWTPSATETNGYEWMVFHQGDDPLIDPFVEDGGTATGVTEAMISGLDESTSYDFYVRSNCGPDGLSDWEGPFTFTTDTSAGLNDNTLNGFVFYPNPVSGIIYLQAHDDIHNVAIYNLLGQEVILHQVSSNITQLDVSGLASGTYLLKVSNSINETGFYKLLKQ